MVASKGRRTVGGASEADEALARRFKKGDETAFVELVRRYSRKLHVYLAHLIGGREDTEDLLQNVFVKVYERMHQFDARRKFSPWVYRIARNEATDWMRRRARRPSVAWEDIVSERAEIDIRDESESVEERWIREEMRESVNRALRQVPEKYREVLVLRFHLGKSYAEIAEILEKPENTVATLLNRAKKKLLEEMSVEGVGGGHR